MSVLDDLNRAAQLLNQAAGSVLRFLTFGDLGPTKQFVQKHGPSADKVLNLLEDAANGKVTFVDPSITPSVGEKRLPPDMKKFLEREFGPPGYYPKSTTREPLISHVQGALQSPGGQPLVQDNKMGPETARAILRQLIKQGDVGASPLFK